MRIQAFLIVGLLSILPFTIQAANISSTLGFGVVSSGSSKNCTTALQSQADYMQDLMEQIHTLIKDINAVMKDRPQLPDTSAMSTENAAKIKKQHANAIEHWQQQLVRLQNKLEVLLKKLATAERKLNQLINNCQKAQEEERQTEQMGLEQRRIKTGETTTGDSKSLTVNRRILNIQTQSKKQQKEATQILKRVRTLLR